MKKNINKILVLIIALLIVLIVLISCGGGDEITSGEQPTATPTATPVPTATPTPAPLLGEVLPQELLVSLNMDSFTYVPKVFYLGQDRILITWTDYELNPGAVEEETITCTAIYNLYTGDYKLGPTFDGDFMIAGTNAESGVILGSNYSGKEYFLLNSDLEITKSIVMDNYGAIFNSDFSKYYLSLDGYLYEGDVATDTLRNIEIPYGMRASYIDSYDEANGVLYMAVNTSLYKYGTTNMALEISSGKALSLNNDPMSRNFYNGSAYAVSYGVGGFALNMETNGVRYSVIPSAHETVGMTGFHLVLNSPYFAKNYSYGEDGQLVENLINKLYKIEDGKYYWCDFTSLSNENITYTEYIPEHDMLLAIIPDGAAHKVVVFRCDMLEFAMVGDATQSSFYSVDSAIVDKFVAESSEVAVAEHLEALRQRADDLEERYGFTIFMSNQCPTPLQSSSYTSAFTNAYSASYERDLIAFALNELEQMAAQYPEGFFEQFKDREGNGGIYIFLIGGIQSSNNTIAYFYKGTYFYNIAIDVTYQTGMKGTFSHELWHAIETKMYNIDREWDAGWDELNPDGFAYYDTYDYVDYDSSHWTDYDWRNDGVYFVDAYAKTYAKEDRCRIFEKVMGDAAFADSLMQHETMKKKLDFMCKVIREAFDTTGWGELYWERY